MSRVLISPACDGETLLQALRRLGHIIAAPCGGNGTCGKCRVNIIDGDGSRTVLACRTPLHTSCMAEISPHISGEICMDSTSPTGTIRPGRTGYGAAVDIGTTTLAVRLIDLASGVQVESSSSWNPQLPYGGDVISRCQHIMEHPHGLDTLRDLIRSQVFSIVQDICTRHGIPFDSVMEFYIAGNTVMQHIFCGISPESIAIPPFTPLSLFDDGSAHTINRRKFYFAPCIAGYVGGDITAGLLHSNFFRMDGYNLFVDVGTNGEMVIGGKDGMICCSVACGPAFEGAGISCGMTSINGAVSSVKMCGGKLKIHVIGGGEPRGICGTGLLDIASLLVENDVIDQSGRLLPPDEVHHKFAPYLDEDEQGNGKFFLDRKNNVYLSARDVRQLQLAKAAVAAGIHLLMARAGITAGQVDTLFISGGFGANMNPRSAAVIGMLPASLAERTVPLGNTALAGAGAALLDPDLHSELIRIQKNCRYIELSGCPDFNRVYPEHMFFSEEDEPWS